MSTLANVYFATSMILMMLGCAASLTREMANANPIWRQLRVFFWWGSFLILIQAVVNAVVTG